MGKAKWSSRLFRYALAILLVIAAVCFNLLLTRLIEPSSAPLLFAAVLVAAWQGGWGPGLLATVLASLADDYFFIAPFRSIDFNTPVLVRLAVFLSTSLLTSYLTVKLRKSVSERDQLLEMEREARAAAESANQTKDRFLGVTSHELRAPLSGIMIWADLLAQQNLPADLREGIEAIQQCAQTQKRLIEDLLDMERLRTGKLRLETEPVDLVSAINQAVATARPLVATKNIELSISLDDTPGSVVWADRIRLQQIVMNLLGNAIKFTPIGGKITVSLMRSNSPPTVTIRVIDTGRGIEPQDLPHVFDRFWQAGKTKTTAGDGLGLGLAIVRDLVKLHGGQIHAQSEGKNRGTTFVVELPLMSEQRAAIIPKQPQAALIPSEGCSAAS